MGRRPSGPGFIVASRCVRHNQPVLSREDAPLCLCSPKRRFRICLVLVAFVLWAALAGAAEPLRLGLGDCRARALDTAPALRAAAADLEAGRLGVDIATAGFLPALRAEGGYLRSSVDQRGVPDFAANNGENEYVARAVVSEPLYTGGALPAARSKARAEEVAAGHAVAATRAEVLVTTDQAYFSVLRAAQRQTIAEEGRAVSRELLRAAEVRFRNGEVPALDVGRLELEVAQASTTVDATRADLAIARSELGTLIGLAGAAFEVEPLPEDEGPPSSESLDDIVGPALTARPEVKRLEAELQALESAVGLAHGARLPQVHAEAAGGYDSLTLPDRQNAGWDAGLTVSIPLWDWNILARRERIAGLEVEKARQRLAAAKRAVTLEVTRRYLEADLAHRRLATTVQAERLAERNAETARKGYGLGLLSSLELITAQRQATAAASERAAAEFDQRLARSQLDFAAGRLQ